MQCKYCQSNLIIFKMADGKSELKLCPTCDKSLAFPALQLEEDLEEAVSG